MADSGAWCQCDASDFSALHVTPKLHPIVLYRLTQLNISSILWNMCSDSFCSSGGVASGRTDQSDRSADATFRGLVEALTEARHAVDALVRTLEARQADSRPCLPDSVRHKAHEGF
jgi:hypothetical protein